mmetsp:Transcript_28573/g.68141  ORF Transcript_28573/g.68141 Transcript_28573/m.68141 type:complete len:248 (-) Transcript_28573:231-974(-)
MYTTPPATRITSAPTPPHTPAMSVALGPELPPSSWSEKSRGSQAVSVSMEGALEGSASMPLTPSAAPNSLTLIRVSSLNTTSICTLADALLAARSARAGLASARRAEQTSSPRSTCSRVTCTVWMGEAVWRRRVSRRERRAACWAGTEGLQASALERASSTWKRATLEAGTPKVLASMDRGETPEKESVCAASPAPCSSSESDEMLLCSSTRRRALQFSSSEISANRKIFCDTEKGLLPAVCVGVHS